MDDTCVPGHGLNTEHDLKPLEQRIFVNPIHNHPANDPFPACPPMERSISRLPQIGIVGGGPGGLMTAYLLQKYVNRPIDITIFEMSDRLGGKILTPGFETTPLQYEAGAAEFYDYSLVDDDPLKELIAELGLPMSPMGGSSVLMNGEFLGNLDDIRRHLGTAAHDALRQFHWAARDQMSPIEFFGSGGTETVPVSDPDRRFDAVLQTIAEPAARQFVEHLIHSDLATEPARTSAEYGLQNYLMNDPAYMRLYGIDGGNEMLPQSLARRIKATIRMNDRVSQIRRDETGCLEIDSRCLGESLQNRFDFVVVALPHDALDQIEYQSSVLLSAMQQHIAHYDFPAHYLRITILFRRPFWNGHWSESYCMLDQLGGCCLYDESSRNTDSEYGILGWLVGGESALERAALTDAELIQQALDSLPMQLRFGTELFLEGRVHRWIGAVNAIPGGLRPRSLDLRHQPEPVNHPNFFVVGDYLFDSTLNGVLDSANYVAEWIAATINEPAGIKL